MLVVEFILDPAAVWREHLVPDFCSRLKVESLVFHGALKDVFSCVEMPSWSCSVSQHLHPGNVTVGQIGAGNSPW